MQQLLTVLADEFDKYRDNPDFQEDFRYYLKEFVGRENPLTYAESLTKKADGCASIYLKREDLNHTGAHKINNVVEQILIAKRIGMLKE